MGNQKMKSLFFKKNYITGVPIYLILLLWYTGKFALIQTCKYAPLFILVPRCKMRSITKPWKKVKEAAYKVMKNKSLIWQFRGTDYKKLYCYLNVFGWKHLSRYTQFWSVWDHKLLFRIKEKWWRRDARNKRTLPSSFHSRRFFRDGHVQLLKFIKKTAVLTNQKMLKSIHYNTKLNLYRRMPWRAMSRLWGLINSIDLPHWLRKPAYRLYIWMFDCHVEEAVVEDISRYKNLSEFFRRMLKPGMRPLDAQVSLTSPADGRVLYCGRVKNGALEQVKGVTYSLYGFLGPNFSTSGISERRSGVQCSSSLRTPCNRSRLVLKRKRFPESAAFESTTNSCTTNGLLTNPLTNSLFYCVIYLAPGDYHRFHSPADWYVQNRRHFPGELFSVKPSVAKWLKGLFNMNERVVYFGEWKHGFFSMTPVGATNVGSISIYIDKGLKTNTPNKLRKGYYIDKTFIDCDSTNFYRKVITGDDDISDQDNEDGIVDAEDDQRDLSNISVCNDESKNVKIPGVFTKKGKLFGEFNLGSTIVLLFEAPRNFKFSVTPGQKINYGQALTTQ